MPYELFDNANKCSASLPVNSVTDEFTLIRFFPILDADGVTPIVVPNDLINDKVTALMIAAYPDAPLKLLRGGGVFTAERKDAVGGAPGRGSMAIPVKTLEDVNRFLSDPRGRLEGKAQRVSLTQQNVRQLRELGTTVAFAGSARSRRIVRLIADPPATSVPPAIFVRSLDQLLVSKVVHSPTGEIFRINLSADNVHELRHTGVSKIAVKGGGSLYLRLSDPPPDDGGTGNGGSGDGQDGQGDGNGSTKPPTPAAVPRFELVLYAPYKHSWALQGYSRGELINRISLGPQEDTTIELYTWDRTRRLKEETTTSEREAAAESTLTEKDSLDAMRQTTTDAGWKITSLNVTIPSGPTIGVGGNVGKQVQTLNRDTHQLVTDIVQKVSSRLKVSRQVKVEETREFGSEQRVTRKIKNPNMCHALHMDYFQVLATYNVSTELLLDRIRLCVLTPNLIHGSVNRDFVLSHFGALQDALLNPSYLDGFEAARLLAAHEHLCDLICGQLCWCEPGSPGSIEDASKAATAAIDRVKDSLATLSRSSPQAFCKLAEDFSPQSNPAWPAARTGFERWVYWKLLEFDCRSSWSELRDLMTKASSDVDTWTRIAAVQI